MALTFVLSSLLFVLFVSTAPCSQNWIVTDECVGDGGKVVLVFSFSLDKLLTFKTHVSSYICMHSSMLVEFRGQP